MDVQILIHEDIDGAHGIPSLWAFREGLSYLGVPHRTVSYSTAAPSEDSVLVCWGVYKKKLPKRKPLLDLQTRQKLSGGGLLILERGFVRRESYYLVAWDDLNGRGRFPHDRSVSGDRWEALGVRLQDWREGMSGAPILLVGQVPWDTSCQHADLQEWVSNQITRIVGTGREVIYRPHPLQPQAIKVSGVEVSHRPLEEDLARVSAVQTFSSTVGVDALIAGVPAIASDWTSMVYGECGGDVLRPLRYPRRPWANWLAYCQWTHEEMSRGLPWLHFYGV